MPHESSLSSVFLRTILEAGNLHNDGMHLGTALDNLNNFVPWLGEFRHQLIGTPPVTPPYFTTPQFTARDCSPTIRPKSLKGFNETGFLAT